MLYYYVSIPNGMEFYCGQGGFTRHRSSVSIPNGMEFYKSLSGDLPLYICFNSQRDGILLLIYIIAATILRCFNSQRDGILPISNRFFLNRYIVSIPNGMEFYSLNLFKRLTIAICFNSQRDGILLRDGFISCDLIAEFQFPTGWNSTQSSAHLWLARSVSIPNGMEFYFISRSDFGYPRLFQFPTGWNSTFYIRH